MQNLSIFPQPYDCHRKRLQRDQPSKIIEVSRILHVSLDKLIGLNFTGSGEKAAVIEQIIPLLHDCSESQLALLLDIIKAVKKNSM